MKHDSEQIVIAMHRHILQSNLCIALHDNQFNYILASKAWAELVNYPNGEALAGQKAHEVSPVLCAEFTRELARLAAEVRAAQQPQVSNYQLVKLKYMLRVRCEPIFSPDGEIVATKTNLQRFKFFHPVALINGLVARPFLYAQTVIEEEPVKRFNQEEFVIMFMLMLQFTRKEIADQLGEHISKINRRMAALADKLPAKSRNQEHLLAAIVARGLHRYLPETMVDKIASFARREEISPDIQRIFIDQV